MVEDMKTGFLKSNKLAGGLGLLLALVLLLGLSVPVAAVPLYPPHNLFGTSHFCGTPTDVTARIQGTDLIWTFTANPATGDFIGTVPADDPDIAGKDGAEDGDIIDLEVMGQVLDSIAWASGQTNHGPPYPAAPLDLDALPYLTTSSDDNGTVTTPGEGTYGPYTCGQDVTIEATADEDYVFDEWTGDIATIDDVNAASTFITMNGVYSIVANFVPEEPVEYCDLTPTSTAGGHVETPGEEGPYPYECGTDADIVAVVDDDCYEFTEWTGDVGTVNDVNAASTFITMNGDYDIVANFTKIMYDLSTSSTTGGHVATPGEGDPVGTYECCTIVPIEAVVDLEDYEFSHWSGDTGTIDDVNAASTTIHMDDDCDIVANFVEEGVEYCDLTPTSTAGGHVATPGEAGPYSYVCGTDADIVAVVDDACYEFSHWSGDTGTIDDVNAASTFITMNGDYEIVANFTKIMYGLSTSSTEGGSVTTPGEGDPVGTYECCTVVPIEAVAVGCYNFVEWTGDIATIDDVYAASTTIHMDDDYEIVANFELAEELEDLTIPFNEDWNTFSTPISLHDCVNTWAEFIEANDLDIIMIYGYDAVDGWVTVNDGDEIEPLYGFYVKTSEAGMAHIIPNGEETPLPTRELSRGVHLIGPAPESLGDIDVWSMLISLYYVEAIEGHPESWGYTMVVSPEINSPNNWAYPRPEPFPEDSPLMNSGRAYWVAIENADEYVGQTSTPLVEP
jgi:hypothetical protein